MKSPNVLASLGLTVTAAAAQSTVGAYGQCGGSDYTGPTACGSGYTCTEYNAYYDQCVPGTAASTSIASTSSASTSTPLSTTLPSTTTTSSSAVASSSSSSSTSVVLSTTTSPSSTGTTTTTTDTPTLVSGWYWIRAVESPYSHSYLQTLPTATPGDAVLDDASTAGQFNIIDGQLVYNTGPDDDAAPLLYMWVEDPADKTQRALATWFNSTASPYGNFSFSGDTVTWTDPDVARPNTAAFYVCPGNSSTEDAGAAAAGGGENALFVNTGAYLYETPSGCYDVDIHSYGGATAVV